MSGRVWPPTMQGPLRDAALAKKFTSTSWLSAEQLLGVPSVALKPGAEGVALTGPDGRPHVLYNVQQTTDPAALWKLQLKKEKDAHRNGLTGKAFSSGWEKILSEAATARGYKSPHWVTASQMRFVGGGVDLKAREVGVEVPMGTVGRLNVLYNAEQTTGPDAIKRHANAMTRVRNVA